MTLHRPVEPAAVADIIQAAAATRTPLALRGTGARQALGRHAPCPDLLDMSGFSGGLDYQPSELVFTADAGMALASIEALLAQNRQMLAFEPPDWSDLLGASGTGTLGGLVATNIAGPRRVKSGAPRDHFLGFHGVNGRGEMFKAGGRVVKNVTGYDLAKVQAGAFGTLAVLTKITLKVVPAPETSATLLVTGEDAAQASRTMAKAMNSPHEVSAAAFLPRNVAELASSLTSLSSSATLLRLEGHGPSVAFRMEALRQMLGAGEIVQEAESVALWRQIGSVQPLLQRRDSLLWKLNPTPSAAPAVLEALAARLPVLNAFLDWGGGLIWLELDAATPEAGAGPLRAIMAMNGGHAMLVRAPESLRGEVAVFEPPAIGVAALSQRIKAAYDPGFVLNPGRMYAGG